MKQQVINYEFDLIHKQVLSSPHLPKHDPSNYRYGSWELSSTLQKIVSSGEKYTIKWIGNSINANLLAFFYCILLGSLKDEGDDDDTFTKVKYALYGVCREWLTIGEQKTFVEHLCLVQYSKSITQFLKKSNHLENILIKVFAAFKRELKQKQHHHKSNQKEYHHKQTKLEQLQQYAILFPFISFNNLNEKASQLVINGVLFHIVEEKDCIFVVEYKDKKPYRRIKTEDDYKTNKKKKQKKLGQIVEEDQGESSRKVHRVPQMINSVGYMRNLAEKTNRQYNSKQSTSNRKEYSPRKSKMKPLKKPSNLAPTTLLTLPSRPENVYSNLDNLRTSIRIEKDAARNTFLQGSPRNTEPIIKRVPSTHKKKRGNEQREKKSSNSRDKFIYQSLEHGQLLIDKKVPEKVPRFLKQKKQPQNPSSISIPSPERRSSHNSTQKTLHANRKPSPTPHGLPLTSISSQKILNFKTSQSPK